MRGFHRSHLAQGLLRGLLMIVGFCGMTEKVSAQNIGLIFTVHVSNYAGVNSKTLADAEKFATAVFRNSGVEARWVAAPVPVAQRQSGPNLVPLTEIRVSILPKKIAEQFGFPGGAVGYAPGTGADRQQTYVLYDKMEALAQNPAYIAVKGPQFYHVTKPVILGMALAHEIGHLLLNLESHSPTGIMLANWSMNDLLEASYGNLAFTTQQAESIRGDVARRMGQ